MSTQIPGLYILETEEKGRGIYTSIDISAGDIIESAPVIICDSVDTKLIHKTHLHDYYFIKWKKKILFQILTSRENKNKPKSKNSSPNS